MVCIICELLYSRFILLNRGGKAALPGLLLQQRCVNMFALKLEGP